MNDRAQYLLPGQTARQLTSERVHHCTNLRLLLDRYVPQRVLQSGTNRGLAKCIWLQEITDTFAADAELTQSAYTRWSAIAAAHDAHSFRAATDGRVVVGLGSETVLETGLTLHALYGLPYIPASALKGMTRAYVTGEVAGHSSKRLSEDDTLVRRIFGSQETGGSVIFFDALPQAGKFSLALDILNVHYPDYYSGRRLPTDDQQPRPLPLLTVTDTIFVFALAARHPLQDDASNDVTFVRQWLQEALQDYGIGGKTSAGYGYFNILP